MEQDFAPAAKSSEEVKEPDAKYKVNMSGWSSDECPNSPILTDNDCMICGEEALWSCKPCDAKYCSECWSEDHKTKQHEKTTFKYKTHDTNGKVTLSNPTTATEVLGSRDDQNTASNLLNDFLNTT